MTIEYCIRIACSREHVFSIYRDIDSWAKWDPDIEAVALHGEFAAGTRGWLKPVGAPKTATRMVSVNEPSSFTVESRLPFCTITFEHVLDAIGNETDTTHRVLFRGALAPLFSKIIGGKIKKGIQGTMEGLKRYAES
ncbi:MAG: SRPBCC family protein [Granulosicoccus sp.]